MSSTLKIGIVGDCDVGKSSLIASFINKSSTFITNIKPTMGINYEVVTNNHSKSVHQFSFASTSNHYYTIQLWDVSGHETSSIFAKGLYPHLDALILVFDITNSKSLQSCCSYWLNEVRKLSKSVAKLHKLTMLLGNKIDQHVFDHSVSIEEQSRVADRYDIPFCVSNSLFHT